MFFLLCSGMRSCKEDIVKISQKLTKHLLCPLVLQMPIGIVDLLPLIKNKKNFLNVYTDFSSYVKYISSLVALGKISV